MTSPNLAGLKPCPFCGGMDIRIMRPTCTRDTPYNPAHRAFPVAHCWTCNTEVPGENWDSLGMSALQRWNTRAALRTVSDEPGAGRKLVPVEPTAEMIEAGLDYDEREFEIRTGRIPKVEDCQAGEYRAMLEAAPNPAIPADTQSQEGEA